MLDDEGANEGAIPASQLRSFVAGQLVDIMYDYWDARGGVFNGVMRCADMSIRDMVLHRDGSFGSAEQNENWWRGNKRESRNGATGRYCIDGYLTLAQRLVGVVGLHFTIYQLVNGYLHLVGFDGRQFTPRVARRAR